MNKFIEVHEEGNPRLVNLEWVEEIRPMGDKQACIYFAFSIPNGVDQDFLEVDESYDTLVNRIVPICEKTVGLEGCYYD